MTQEATDFEITIYGFRDSDHMVDWLRDCRRAGESFTKRHRQRAVRATVPGGLLTAAQAAAKLNCSIKTLNGHVKACELKYVIIGRGSKRPRRMFTDADLVQFITDQT